ncbi:MAG: L-serine ammonia-lyase, iron-sulfur-dependent, subunit alpha [Clostridia bacterium]|nr:L-serine ammonia-lyase, iron-sulfur-dependent, subunit alpha [Clostridia bacterium]
MDFKSGKALIGVCREEGISISEAMIRRESEVFGAPRDETIKKMTHALVVMRESVETAKAGNVGVLGGYIGGESRAHLCYIEKNGALGGMISRASAYAMGVIEVNASMGRIVAAPTAGSSGVLAGTLIAAGEEYGFDDEKLVRALFNAAAVGYLITLGSTVAGAEGGCQAEVGAASAMAASALCELFGGEPEVCLGAAGDAISNILGLVCDPIGGLVEAPCQKRNAMGVANAVISAEIALATRRTLIQFDDVVKTMKKVGAAMPAELRETALGGLAAVPNVKKFCRDCDLCK